MNKLIRYLLVLACMACIHARPIYAQVGGSHIETDLTIWSPRKHQPTFAEPGQTIVAEVVAAENLPTDGWRATLSNDFNVWESPSVKAVYERIDRDSRSGWQLTIQVPVDAPPELMELRVTTPGGSQLSSPRSVQVVVDMEQDFYILHQSDQHLAGEKAVEPGGKASDTWGVGSKQALEWLAPVVNLINPRLVLETGDNMHLYNNADDWCGMEEAKVRVDHFFEGLSGFTVPTVLATGNHDMGWGDYVDIRPWRKFYTEYVGQRAFSFRMGSVYVLTSEWTSNEFLDWAKADLEQSWGDPTVKYRLLVSHFYDGMDGWTSVASAEYPCDLLVVGHIHRTRVLQTEPFAALSVGTAQDYQRGAFFNFKRTDSGWLTEQPATHADHVNVHRLLGEYGEPTVSAEYTRKNDGTATANAVRIENKLPHDFYDGRVRFVMEKGQYDVVGGQILAHYDSADDDKTIVLVKVNIQQGETRAAINRRGK